MKNNNTTVLVLIAASLIESEIIDKNDAISMVKVNNRGKLNIEVVDANITKDALKSRGSFTKFMTLHKNTGIVSVFTDGTDNLGAINTDTPYTRYAYNRRNDKWTATFFNHLRGANQLPPIVVKMPATCAGK